MSTDPVQETSVATTSAQLPAIKLPEPVALKLQEFAVDLAIKPDTQRALVDVFGKMILDADAWAQKATSINVTSPEQLHEQKFARAARMALRDIRIAAEKKMKELKEDSIQFNRAVNAIGGLVAAITEPIEKKLKEQEDIAERQEADRVAKIRADRVAIIEKLGVDARFIVVEKMTQGDFDAMVSAYQEQADARAAAARRVEEERIAKEKAADEERQRIAAENERLKAEAAQREEALRIEREQAAAEKAEADRLAAEAEERAAKLRAELAEQQRVEAERRAEVEKRMEAERAERERAEAERAAKEKAERDAIEAQARADRAAREKAEAEAKAARDAEAARLQAEADARAKAEAAPDKEKLVQWLTDLDKSLPFCTSENGVAVVQALGFNLRRFIDQARTLIDTL